MGTWGGVVLECRTETSAGENKNKKNSCCSFMNTRKLNWLF